ncbi:hypothetical protein ACWGNM_15695 [Streptomyces sp. NPDC055796]
MRSRPRPRGSAGALDAKPGGGLLRPKRRLAAQQLGQALPGGDLVTWSGFDHPPAAPEPFG